MTPAEIKALLQKVANQSLSVDAAAQQMKHGAFEELGFSKVDHHRAVRQGFPEVIYAPGKTPAQVVAIAKAVYARSERVLITRLDDKQIKALRASRLPQQVNAVARCVWVEKPGRAAKRIGKVLVLTAGTADIPVAEEAAMTAECMGAHVERIFDVGVAGIHRLLAHREQLATARCVVVVAGMEGALPSAVGGLVPCAVIGVPTSVGYGAAFAGVTPLLGMLNSCAPNVVAVNIDDGFGAGFTAALINRTGEKA